MKSHIKEGVTAVEANLDAIELIVIGARTADINWVHKAKTALLMLQKRFSERMSLVKKRKGEIRREDKR